MKLFFDSEFTGLNKSAKLISLGIVSENNQTFYAEFADYGPVNGWIEENVIANLQMSKCSPGTEVHGPDAYAVKGAIEFVSDKLKNWLNSGEEIQFWGDCIAWDWVLLVDLIAEYKDGYPTMPNGVSYIPMDICPLFWKAGIDPDVSREMFACLPDLSSKHNALHDARIIRACFEKLSK